MIPGMWQVIFSLGVFSSCRFLPRPVAVVGAWYLLTGLTCISLADNRALLPGPWAFRMEPAKRWWPEFFFSPPRRAAMKAKASNPEARSRMKALTA